MVRAERARTAPSCAASCSLVCRALAADKRASLNGDQRCKSCVFCLLAVFPPRCRRSRGRRVGGTGAQVRVCLCVHFWRRVGSARMHACVSLDRLACVRYKIPGVGRVGGPRGRMWRGRGGWPRRELGADTAGGSCSPVVLSCRLSCPDVVGVGRVERGGGGVVGVGCWQCGDVGVSMTRGAVAFRCGSIDRSNLSFWSVPCCAACRVCAPILAQSNGRWGGRRETQGRDGRGCRRVKKRHSPTERVDFFVLGRTGSTSHLHGCAYLFVFAPACAVGGAPLLGGRRKRCPSRVCTLRWLFYVVCTDRRAASGLCASGGYVGETVSGGISGPHLLYQLAAGMVKLDWGGSFLRV